MSVQGSDSSKRRAMSRLAEGESMFCTGYVSESWVSRFKVMAAHKSGNIAQNSVRV